MKTIAVINQKGGVGKTTTVVNLGAAIASRGIDVCLMDLDPQSQLTLHCGREVLPDSGDKSIYDVLTGGVKLSAAAKPVDGVEHLWLIPSVIDLAAAEMELVSTVGREQILSDRIAAESLPYEFMLIDCPPSLGLLTLNALAGADELIIPLQAHFLALQGLGRLLETVSLVQKRINPRLRLRGVVLCMFERNTRLAGEVVADLEQFFAAAVGSDTPWADARIFNAAVRRNVKLAECPSYGKTIFDYEASSHGAQDYTALADEFLACFTPADVIPAGVDAQQQDSPSTAPARDVGPDAQPEFTEVVGTVNADPQNHPPQSQNDGDFTESDQVAMNDPADDLAIHSTDNPVEQDIPPDGLSQTYHFTPDIPQSGIDSPDSPDAASPPQAAAQP